jgi:hypothetical protein
MQNRNFLSIHMLSKILLVFFLLIKFELHNITIVASNLLVVTDIDLFGALGDQSHIVTDHNYTTLKLI